MGAGTAARRMGAPYNAPMEPDPATTPAPLRWWQQAILFAIYLPCFLVVVIGSAIISQTVVRFVHLSLVYGLRPVAEGRIFFASTKPELVVSNGDTLYGLHYGWHFISIVVLWFSLVFGFRFLVNKLSGNRLLKWKWDK